MDLLMQIWKKPYGQIKDWKFWVLGEGVEKSNMENFCKRNNLDRVQFFGKVNPS